MAGVRSPVAAAFAARAVALPGRGRWVVLPARRDLDAVVGQMFVSMGQESRRCVSLSRVAPWSSALPSLPA
jgi:hypothetical protein